MTRQFFLAAIWLAAAGPLAAQRPARATRADIDRSVAEIDAAIPRMRRVMRDVSGLSAEGGEAALYSVVDTLKKVVVAYYGESGRASECYYLRDGQVQFYARSDVRYTRPLSGRIRSATFERVWLDSGSLVFWQDSVGKTRHSAVTQTRKALDVRNSLRTLLDSSTVADSAHWRMPNVRCN
jgi:hypothetical protein